MSSLPESWPRLLQDSVAPLTDGVSSLDVIGWRPRGREHIRPRRTAAVLVGIFREGPPGVILTTRSRGLAQHAGQVAFPGGAADDGDPTGVRTALREAHEEVGLHPDRVQPFGFLDRVDTVSDFRVLPVVGWIRGNAKLVPDEQEVDDVFIAPLDLVLNPASYAPTRIHRDGETRLVYSLPWQGRNIWGVTAAILHNLAIRMQRELANG